MNKTININLGGLFFHIDETAYQKLNKYLNSIRKSLSDDPQGQDEIIKDIESRISELLSEKIVDERQVVSESDIDNIIKIMGQPEDYTIDEEIFNEQPPRSYRRSTSKKLYRDSGDKFLGGVASGTAHYLGIEPIWSRIIWLVVGFGTGVGFFAYILLWVLLPEARSTAEKLEMEGETVNIDNIEKKIREEFSEISERVKESANEVSGKIKDGVNDISEKISSADYKKYKSKTKSSLQEFLDTIGTIILTLFKIFAKFVGALIVFISAMVFISLVIGMFSWGSLEYLGFGEQFLQYPPEIFYSTLPHWVIVLFFFFAVAIPFIVLFMLGLKILSSNTKSFGKITKLTLIAIWIISILGLIFSGIDISNRYSASGISTTKENIAIVKNDTLSISMTTNKDLLDTKRRHRSNSNLKIVTDDGAKKLYSNNIGVDVRKSDTDVAYIKIRKQSHGKNSEDANSNAEKLEYQFRLDGKNLRLNNYFLNETRNSIGFFNQGIDVILYLPKGTIVYLDSSTRNYLDDVSNVQNIYDRSMIKHHYIMGESELDCIDCKGSDYENNTNSDNLNLKIEDDGVNLKITSEGGEVNMTLDSSGVTIE